jgi:predicted transcriptional regulator
MWFLVGVFLLVKYRGRLEIIVDILNVAREGARKTKIMYVANLSYRLLEKYLEETVRLGFMCFNDYHYEVTEKGRTFLEKYSDFSSRYSKVDSELQRVLLERESLERLCEPPREVRARVVSQRRR